MAIFLPKGSLVTVNGVTLSDHNRSPARIDYDYIGSSSRAITGTLTKQVVTKKRKISLSWSNLPALDSQTADGMAGRNSLSDIHDTLTSEITEGVIVTYKTVDADNNQTTVTLVMMLDSYNEQLNKRYDKQLWDVQLNLVEV